MKKFTAAFVFVVVVSCSQLGFAAQFAPATEFTLRDSSADGYADSLDIGPEGSWMFGYIQRGICVDETFIEFNLDSLQQGIAATLEMDIMSPSPLNDTRVARKFEVSTYVGSGAPDFSRFGAGDSFMTLYVDAPSVAHQSVTQTYSLDITSLVSNAIADGRQFLGFRLHDTADMTPGSNLNPIVLYQGGSARIESAVPEPSTLVFVGVGAIGLFGWRRRRAA